MRVSLWLLATGAFVSGTAIRVVEPMLPKLVEEFGTTRAEAAGVITAFALAYGFFQLVHGPLGDRLGKLRMIGGALILAGLATFGCATAATLETLALYRFLAGMTAGAVIPLSFAFIGDNIPFESRQAVLGQFISGILLGGILGPLLGGLFSDWLGWRYTFFVPGAAFLAIGAALAWRARRERVDRGQHTRGVLAVYGMLLRVPGVRALCLFVALESVLFHCAFAYFGVYMRETFAFSFTVIGLCVAGFGLGGLGYSASVRWLVQHVGQPRMVLIGGLLLCLMFALMVLWPREWLMAPLIMLGGYAFNMMHNTMQTLSTEMAPGSRGAGVALFAFSLFFGQAIGVAVGGDTIDAFGYLPVFLCVGAGMAVLGYQFGRWVRAGGVRPGS